MNTVTHYFLNIKNNKIQVERTEILDILLYYLSKICSIYEKDISQIYYFDEEKVKVVIEEDSDLKQMLQDKEKINSNYIDIYIDYEENNHTDEEKYNEEKKWEIFDKIGNFSKFLDEKISNLKPELLKKFEEITRNEFNVKNQYNHNKKCNNCNENIDGILYFCSKCNEIKYRLCKKCLLLNSKKNFHPHLFYAIANYESFLKQIGVNPIPEHL